MLVSAKLLHVPDSMPGLWDRPQGATLRVFKEDCIGLQIQQTKAPTQSHE